METNVDPNISSVELEPQVSIPSEPIKKKRKWWILLLLISVFSICIAGYFAYKYTRLKYSTQDTKQEASTPTSVFQADTNITASWKTYTGKTFQYKYPESLYLVDSNYNDGVKLYINKQTADESENCIKNKLGTIENPCSYPTIAVIIKKYDLVGKSASQVISENLINILNPVDSKTISGIPFTKDRLISGGMALSVVLRAHIISDNSLYNVDIQTDPAGSASNLWKNYEDQYEVLNQILSTFKFTNETKSIYNGWTEYKDERLHFSILHPRGWYEYPPSDLPYANYASISNYDLSQGKVTESKLDPGKIKIDFYVVEKSKNMSLREWVESQPYSTEELAEKTISSIELNGIEGIRVDTTFRTIPSTSIYIQLKDTVFEIAYQRTTDEDLKLISSVLNTIILN